MHQAPTILVILLGILSLVAVYLAAWARFRSHVPGSYEFSWLVLCGGLYTMGYAIEISRTDLHGVLAAIRLEYTGLAFIPAWMILFALSYTRAKPLRPLLITATLAIPIITLGLVYSIEDHSLFYINPRIINGEFFPALDFERGVWYYVHFFYMLTMTLSAVTLLVINAVRADPLQRNQALAIAAGSLIPILTTIIYFLGGIPGNIDPGPFSMVLTTMVFALALFKLGLFELVPAARELALDSIRDSFLVFDQEGRLQDMNRAARHLPGADTFCIGENLPEGEPLADQLQLLVKSKQTNIEFSPDDAETSTRHFNARGYQISTTSKRDEGVAILISDVTETVELIQQLDYQANTDALTGIFNRRHLMKMGELEIARSRRTHLPLSIIMLDLDNFKEINDQHGHAAGDAVLKSTARCLQKDLRNIDILGRYGGEEFVIFLPGTDGTGGVQLAERLRSALAAWVTCYENAELVITASFGVHSTTAEETTDIDDLLKIADEALYQAKAAGRNRVAMMPETRGNPGGINQQ